MATVQFSILPSFQSLTLPDQSPLDDAINYILLTLRKSSTITPETCKSYSNAISNQTGIQSIGELRVLTDADFKSLQVPAMLRIYLKYLVRGTQSGRIISGGASSSNVHRLSVTAPSPSVSPSPGGGDAFMIGLQNDFNYGQPFDMSLYKAHLESLALMGFTTNQSMEALCMVENKNVESACELILSTDASQRREKRARLVERLGRQAKPDGANSGMARQPSASTPGSGGDLQSLQNELALVRSQMVRERTARIAQSSEYKTFIESTLPLKIYSEYLKSLLVKEYILPIEMEQLQRYRDKNKIDMKAHVTTLMELGIESASALDSLVRKVDKNKSGPGAGGNIQQPGDMDCVVCLDKPKNHIIQNCMHLCLCEDCASSYRGPSNTFTKPCPICSKKITQISKIYV